MYIEAPIKVKMLLATLYRKDRLGIATNSWTRRSNDDYGTFGTAGDRWITVMQQPSVLPYGENAKATNVVIRSIWWRSAISGGAISQLFSCGSCSTALYQTRAYTSVRSDCRLLLCKTVARTSKLCNAYSTVRCLYRRPMSMRKYCTVLLSLSGSCRANA